MSRPGHTHALKKDIERLLEQGPMSRGTILNVANPQSNKGQIDTALRQLRQESLILLDDKTATLVRSRFVSLANKRVWNANVFA